MVKVSDLGHDQTSRMIVILSINLKIYTKLKLLHIIAKYQIIKYLV